MLRIFILDRDAAFDTYGQENRGELSSIYSSLALFQNKAVKTG